VASRVSAPFATPRLKIDSTTCDFLYSLGYSFGLSSLLAFQPILPIRNLTKSNVEESKLLLEAKESRVWKKNRWERHVTSSHDMAFCQMPFKKHPLKN
jgi:hypothetical protein